MKDSNCQDRDVARRLLHTTVFCQCFSPCGKYLAAANNFGNIAVYSLTASLASDASEDSRQPLYTFKGSDGAIYSLVSTQSLLISAGNGDIMAWNWSDIQDKAAKVVWSLKIPQIQAYSHPEVNSMALTAQETGTQLYAGCGDNNVYAWDIETGQQTAVFGGHSDYVHSIIMKNSGRECVSASEDGTVRIWDCRNSRDAMHILEPYKNEMTARPEVGKWIGCVECDSAGDWMVCGGGPHLAAWHLRSLSPMATFNAPGATHNCVMFYEDTVLSGGSEAYVNHWFINGDLKAKVPCSPNTVFSINVNTKSDANKVLSVSGSSPKIDICTNFGYKAFSMVFSA